MATFEDRINETVREEADRHPLTDDDRRLIERVQIVIDYYYEPGFHQLASVGLGLKNHEYIGVQFDSKIGQFSCCAEFGVQHQVAVARDKLKLIVTARKGMTKDGLKVHLVMPCAGCRERLVQFEPQTLIIIPFNDEPIKVPIKTLYQLQYATRERPEVDTERLAALNAEWVASQRERFEEQARRIDVIPDNVFRPTQGKRRKKKIRDV